MKKTLVVALILTLVLALAVPSLAFAGRGGVKGANRGNRETAADAAQTPLKHQKAPKAPKEGAAEASEDAPADGAVESSSETTPPMNPGKRKGITNALGRIQATLDRMILEGRTNLPAGLLKVVEKFTGWLAMPDVGSDEGAPDGTELDPGVGGEIDVDGDGIPDLIPIPDPLPYV